MRIRIMAATTALAIAATVAWAQDDTADPEILTPPPEKCRVEPAQPGDPATDDSTGTTGETLSETLDDCNGVLRPPPTGDAGIAEPPPEEGRTPTIRPEDLPEQQTPE